MECGSTPSPQVPRSPTPHLGLRRSAERLGRPSATTPQRAGQRCRRGGRLPGQRRSRVHNRSTPDSRWWRGDAVTQPSPDGGLSAPVTLPGRPSHRAAPSMTDMDITIQASFLPQDDPDAALAFYRDALGFEVRNDVGYGGMRWLTVGPADQPGMSIVLYPPGADPGITDDERRTIVEMMAKGTYAIITLATKNLDGTFEQLRASGAEVVQEPTEQPYGVRDCAFRDPAGNMVRINELR